MKSESEQVYHISDEYYTHFHSRNAIHTEHGGSRRKHFFFLCSSWAIRQKMTLTFVPTQFWIYSVFIQKQKHSRFCIESIEIAYLKAKWEAKLDSVHVILTCSAFKTQNWNQIRMK